MADHYKRLDSSKRVPLTGARAIGRANAHAVIEVLLKLRRKKQLPELTGRPTTTMTRDALAATYGASAEDISKVSAVFGKLGLKTVSASPAARTVRLAGTVAAMERAFQVKLINYYHAGGNYRGRVGYVSIPAEVAGIVEGVFGLDNRRVARRSRVPIRDGRRARALSAVNPAWYKPAELAARYHFPDGDGSGQTVALLEFAGGYFPDDLKKFCQLAGVGEPNVTTISVDGTPTDAQDGAEGEVMLDIEVVAGVCPKAKIVVYFAEFTEPGWLAALDAVVHDAANDPSVLSISWGEPEDTDRFTSQVMTEINEILKEAAHLGITVCVAAGDDGSSDADLDGLAHVDFPAASPFVLAVGGTTIPVKGGTQPDIVWFEGNGLRPVQPGDPDGGSTGGGCSSATPRPAWQANIDVSSVNPGAIVGRCIPDLAANADWDASPYLLVVDGQPQGNGGTSAAAPLVASLIALLNAKRGPGKRVGYLTPVLYQSKGGGSSGPAVGAIGCTDVVTGNNNTAQVGGYSAGPGYDAVSGWGTPNGVKLLEALPF
jgi:kumamolisin